MRIYPSSLGTHRLKNTWGELMDTEKLAAEGALTVRDSARFLGISERQVYRMIANGELVSLRSGTRGNIPARICKPSPANGSRRIAAPREWRLPP